MAQDNQTQDTENITEDKNKKKGFPFLIVFGSIAAIALLSLLPWSKITGNIFKDYNLFSDVVPSDEPVATAQETIDPELKAALEGQSVSVEAAPAATAEAGTASASKTASEQGAAASTSASATTTSDAAADAAVALPANVKPRQAARAGGKVRIEDYTTAGRGLARLRTAIANRSRRPARIAVIGDSYIEGDILTSDLRSDLQSVYGGSGVGYVPMTSPVAGFRTSVREKSSGWTVKDIRKKMPEQYKALSGEYCLSAANASTTLTGSSKLPHQNAWTTTKFLFIAPNDAKFTLTAAGKTNNYVVKGSPDVQCILMPGNTTSATLKCATPGVIALGMYLDSGQGIAVDNMSLRGNSGITHRFISTGLAADMRRFVDYDLIIVEYGINALTSQQKNYAGYKKLMHQAIVRIKACYPNADILIMGIGDRGQKAGGTVKSIPTAQFMVDAQRDLARETGCLFWDTREAMGGEDAVVEWRNKGFINPDYIHLNAKGGAALATLLTTAIRDAVK